jgi:hypothetical protein
MEPRVSLITLGVADIARARRFYEALGWTASGAGNEHVVFFQLGGLCLSLYGREALAKDAGLTNAGPASAGLRSPIMCAPVTMSPLCSMRPGLPAARS